jgi:hypothetical protein
MNSAKMKIKSILFACFILCACALISSCDQLEDDNSTVNPKVSNGDNIVYVMPNSTGFIDLYQVVKGSGNSRFEISSRPQQGSLTELAVGMLQYSPAAGFNNGRDAFSFSLYSANNKLLSQDTVTIMMSPDTTSLPCGVYANADYSQLSGGTVTTDVLANDVLCHGPNYTKLVIYRPNNSFPPYYGTATLENHKIKYTAGANFNGKDKVMYKIMDAGDTSKYSFAMMYVTASPLCSFNVQDDLFNFSGPNNLYDLDVFANDQLCTNIQNDYSFNIVYPGRIGTAEYGTTKALAFKIPPTQTTSFTDTVRYQLCYDGLCKSAKVIINVSR